MAFTHDEDKTTLDTNMEDFFMFLPFQVGPPPHHKLTLCPQQPGDRAYFALVSFRRSDGVQRKPPTNDGKEHDHTLDDGAGNKIVIKHARLVRSIRHKRSGDRLMLDLFELQNANPVDWFDLNGWAPTFAIPEHGGGNPIWDQSVALTGHGTIPYAWDVYNVHASGAAGSESLGLVLPLLSGGFVQTLQGLCANVSPGATGGSMVHLSISSDGDQTVFNKPAGGGLNSPGFAAIASGAFAPPDSRSINYGNFKPLGGKSHDEIVDFLQAWVLPNWERRKEILARNPNERLPGKGIPVEMVYFEQLGNARAPRILG
jgi:hypothetical protein